MSTNADIDRASPSPARRASALPSLVVWLLLSAVVATFGSYFEPGSWYQTLTKPSWTPPSWLFGPVWTLLYIAMAVAAWLVYRTGGWKASSAGLTVYVIQMVLNAAWSWLFFGERLIGVALIDIVLMLIGIVITTVLFWRRRPSAGLLMLPYALWVSFAAALNYELWILNRIG